MRASTGFAALNLLFSCMGKGGSTAMRLLAIARNVYYLSKR